MQISAARLTFHLLHATSLKSKRQVSRSLISRLRQKFNVSAAEVDNNDRWQTLVVGVAFVSNAYQHADHVLDLVLNYVQSLHLDAELVDVDRDTIGGVESGG